MVYNLYKSYTALSNICIHPPICANYKFLNWNVLGISGRFRDPCHHLVTVNSKRELVAKFAPNPPNLHHGKWTGKTFSHYLGHLLKRKDMCRWVDQVSISISGRWSGPTFNDGNACSMGILTINPMELG